MTHKHWIAIDIETIPDETAYPLLEPPQADKRLKDADKVAADLLEKTLAQRARMSLDPYAGQIVCLGFQTNSDDAPQVYVCHDEQDEAEELARIAQWIQPANVHRHVLGYRIIGFDWPWLVTRARLLGVRFPDLDTRKYGNRDITDLWSLLTFDGNLPEGAFPRRLKTICRRFGIPVEDDTDGADVATLAREGRWDAIADHCRSDVALTVALAARLNLVAPVGILSV